VAALAGPGRTLTPAELEVAVLVRGNGRRAFRRVTDEETGAALAGGELTVEPPPEGPAPAEATSNEPEPSAEVPASAGDEPETPPDRESEGE
jgi:hypothetical protein